MRRTRRTAKRSARLSLAGLLYGLAAWSPTTAAGDPPVVACDRMTVSTREETVAREALIEALAAACGLRLVRHTQLSGAVPLPGEALPLPEFVDRVLTGSSYQLHVTNAADPRRGALWIFSAGDAIPPDAALLFETALLQADVGERREAVRQLRRIGNDDAARLLSLALADPDARIRAAAEEALAAIGSMEALAVLTSAAANGDTATRAEATVALSTTDRADALDDLARGLADPDPRVRATTVHALGNLDAPASRQLLRRAFDDPDETVRQAALDVLAELDDDALFRAVFPPD
jgi:hypothetical protein